MNPERWKRVKDLHEHALDLPTAERRDFLVRECGEDRELLEEVAAILAEEDAADAFLEPPGSAPEPELPRTLGDFELVSVLGRGGMGIVYRARQLSLDREVALKVLGPYVARGRRHVDRFRREARAIAKLRHPGIVPIHAVGEAEGYHFFAMELVAGHDLNKEILLHRGELDDEGLEPMLPPVESNEYVPFAARLILGVARAVQHAHERRIVHRDVKPQNLLLSTSGDLRLVDFGLAKDEDLGSLSRTGELLGTPYYMSPEQVRSSRDKVDHRTDIYSLGVVMYELLTLKRPFEGSTSREILESIARKEARPVRAGNPRVPRDLEVIVHKAMSKLPGDRYDAAGELADDLERFLRHEAIRARPIALPKRVLRLAQRHRVAVGLSVALVVAGFLGGAVGQGMVRANRIHRLVTELQTDFADRTEGIAALPATELRRLRSIMDDLEGEDLTAETSALLGSLGAELATYRREKLAEAEGHAESARGVGIDPAAAQWYRARAAATLQELSFVFSEDIEVRDRLSQEIVTPVFSVTAEGDPGDVLQGTVWAREIDLYTTLPGERTRLGRLPLEGFPMRPGYYRIVVEFDDGAFREATRHVRPSTGRVAPLFANRVGGEPTTKGMVLFEESDLAIPESGRLWCHLAGETVRIPAFYLDEAEVSNGEYLRFLEARPDQPLPRTWEGAPRPEGWEDLPVTGVSWYEAVAYAEWAGKRLPTHVEWERAARGLEARLYPWPESTSPTPRAHVHVEYDDYPETREDVRPLYLEHAMPVRSLPEARTPEGLYHMLGNVSEYTESIVIVEDSGSAIPRVLDRIRMGGDWTAASIKYNLERHAYNGIGSGYEAFDQGFRCARSEKP